MTDVFVAPRKAWYSSLFVQLLVAIVAGIAVGWLWPAFGADLKPLADGFIKLIKMLIAPIIFCTVVIGIAHVGNLKSVGRIGVKALIYFEVVTTFALLFGLVIGNLVKPGAGFNIDPQTLATGAEAVAKKTGDGELPHTVEFISTSFRRPCFPRLPRTCCSRCCSLRCCSGWRWRSSVSTGHRWSSS
jgi:aerobic C4-dicarboxylate transport protein